MVVREGGERRRPIRWYFLEAIVLKAFA